MPYLFVVRVVVLEYEISHELHLANVIIPTLKMDKSAKVATGDWGCLVSITDCYL